MWNGYRHRNPWKTLGCTHARQQFMSYGLQFPGIEGRQKLCLISVSFMSWWFWEKSAYKMIHLVMFTSSRLALYKDTDIFIISHSGFINTRWNMQKINFTSCYVRYLQGNYQRNRLTRTIQAQNCHISGFCRLPKWLQKNIFNVEHYGPYRKFSSVCLHFLSTKKSAWFGIWFFFDWCKWNYICFFADC